MNHIRTFIIYAVATLILLLNAAEVSAQKAYSSSGRVDMDKLVGTSDIEKLSKLPDGFDAAADSYEFIGDNLVARGNAVVQAPGIELSADKIVVNMDSDLYDVEAAGNVTFSVLSRSVRRWRSSITNSTCRIPAPA